MLRYILHTMLCMVTFIVQGVEETVLTQPYIEEERYRIQQDFLKRFNVSYHETKNLTYTSSPIKDPFLNVVTEFAQTENEQDLVTDMNKTLTYATEKQLPLNFEVPTAHTWPSKISEYKLDKETVCIMTRLLNKKEPLSHNMAQKLTKEHLERWFMVFNSAFDEYDPEFTKVYKKVIQEDVHQKTDTEHYHYLSNEAPVAIGTLTMYKKCAEISNIGVLASERRKGIATQIVQKLLDRAYELKADHCILTTRSQEALGLYKKLGFATLYKKDVYSLTLQEPEIESE